MKGRIIITPAGKVALFTDEGTLEDGAKVIAEMFALLQAAGIELTDISPVEAHRHDLEGVHTHTHNGVTHSH